MNYTIVLTQKAKNDLTKAKLHYQEILPNLAAHYIREIRIITGYLKSHPFAFQTRNNPPVRCVPMRKFPFMIHYIPIESDSRIIILAILHTNEDPEKWP